MLAKLNTATVKTLEETFGSTIEFMLRETSKKYKVHVNKLYNHYIDDPRPFIMGMFEATAKKNVGTIFELNDELREIINGPDLYINPFFINITAVISKIAHGINHN